MLRALAGFVAIKRAAIESPSSSSSQPWGQTSSQGSSSDPSQALVRPPLGEAFAEALTDAFDTQWGYAEHIDQPSRSPVPSQGLISPPLPSSAPPLPPQVPPMGSVSKWYQEGDFFEERYETRGKIAQLLAAAEVIEAGVGTEVGAGAGAGDAKAIERVLLDGASSVGEYLNPTDFAARVLRAITGIGQSQQQAAGAGAGAGAVGAHGLSVCSPGEVSGAGVGAKRALEAFGMGTKRPGSSRAASASFLRHYEGRGDGDSGGDSAGDSEAGTNAGPWDGDDHVLASALQRHRFELPERFRDRLS
ncbi:hypothetical protein B484DRAFT_440126 [Ochromonadaceae sp. CCMP2298]|nr:hypothetical protein B484DRAFT_440126 [Ochromonadaceae sp. CCMP2298]